MPQNCSQKVSIIQIFLGEHSCWPICEQQPHLFFGGTYFISLVLIRICFISQKSWEIGNYCVISVKPWRHNVHLPLHRSHIFWPFYGSISIICSPAPSSSLRQEGTSDLSLKKIQVATRLDFLWEKCVIIRLLLCDSHCVTVGHRLATIYSE